MKIKILDHEIDISSSDAFEWNQNTFGKCSLQKCSIAVKTGLPVDLQNSTILHELVHLIADMNQVELDEQSVDNLALGVHSLLKNNQHFIEGLWDENGRLLG